MGVRRGLEVFALWILRMFYKTKRRKRRMKRSRREEKEGDGRGTIAKVCTLFLERSRKRRNIRKLLVVCRNIIYMRVYSQAH